MRTSHAIARFAWQSPTGTRFFSVAEAGRFPFFLRMLDTFSLYFAAEAGRVFFCKGSGSLTHLPSAKSAEAGRFFCCGGCALFLLQKLGAFICCCGGSGSLTRSPLRRRRRNNKKAATAKKRNPGPLSRHCRAQVASPGTNGFQA